VIKTVTQTMTALSTQLKIYRLIIYSETSRCLVDNWKKLKMPEKMSYWDNQKHQAPTVSQLCANAWATPNVESMISIKIASQTLLP